MEKVLSFYINNKFFGVYLTLIKEINRNVEYTPVPNSKDYIAGLFNMRGQVVTLFDLVKLMGLEDGEYKPGTTSIVLKAAPNTPNQAGFLVDKVGDVIDVDKDDCEVPPANVVGIDVEFISSVVKLKDKLLIILDPAKIFKT